ncbi:MAG: hypothetical protein AAB354_15050, partial [candidate division KSB1 bacterium]
LPRSSHGSAGGYDVASVSPIRRRGGLQVSNEFVSLFANHDALVLTIQSKIKIARSPPNDVIL